MKPYYQDSAVTIYHGDSRELGPELGNSFSVVSDPPYGMGWDNDASRFSGGVTNRGVGRSDWRPIAGDDLPFDPLPWIEAPQVILWGCNHYSSRLPVGTTLVWLKRNPSSFGFFLSDAELAWQKSGHGVYCFSYPWHGSEFVNRGEPKHHPNEKPVALMKWCVNRVEGGILDPFMGSGTTLRAAKDLGRKAIGIEIDERYCEIAARRMAQEVLFP